MKTDLSVAFGKISDAQDQLQHKLDHISEQVDRLDSGLRILQRLMAELKIPRSEPGAYLTEGEAALYLGVSVRTVRNWRYQGGGPEHVKLGGHGAVRYTRLALDDYAVGVGAE